ncbi:DUF6941 family protein [Saccharicrinis sp. FJH54]|uniref:DUF6941 family protein n=1 Tax=Saccharicrinis sp. FJH54 TaxID=3344665 RepID=UPI0035D4082A
MEVEIFTICDYCQDNHGKMIVIGPFDTIFAREFPATHPVLGIAGRIVFEPEEEKGSDIKILVLDPDGKDLLRPILGKFDLKDDESKPLKHLNICITNTNVLFKKPGKHLFQLFLGDKMLRQISINLTERK